jgi:hypothetical protein
VVFFSNSQKLSAEELRSLYKRIRWRGKKAKRELVEDVGQG